MHDFQSEPIRFCSEIGDDGYEVRKVQEFRDGCKKLPFEPLRVP
ncbi:DUF6881 domain-containing protein [Streptomyces sp. NPDC101234]